MNVGHYVCKYGHLPHPVALLGWHWNLRDAWAFAEAGYSVELRDWVEVSA